MRPHTIWRRPLEMKSLATMRSYDVLSWVSQRDAGEPVLGKKIVDGTDCWELRLTDRKGKAVEYLIGAKRGLVRRRKYAEGTSTVDYDKINKVPSSAFDLPKGIRIVKVVGKVMYTIKDPFAP